MSFIQTSTGIRFELLAPAAEMVRLEDIAGALGKICRWGGQCDRFYSVAQHSLHVADLLRRQGAHPRLQLIGLLHDAHEAYIGDIVSPLKQCLYVETCGAKPPLLDSEVCELDEVAAVIQCEIFRALIPGMADGCETGAEARAWHRADQQALLTELRDLFSVPPVDDWHMTIDAEPDAHPIVHPLPPDRAELLFRLQYTELNQIIKET